jgi:hypothetical protein
VALSDLRMPIVSTLTWMQGWQRLAEQGNDSRLNILASALSSAYCTACL